MIHSRLNNNRGKDFHDTCLQLIYNDRTSSPGNIHLDEDVLKTSWRQLSSLSSEHVFKTSSSRRIYSPYSYVFRSHLQDVLKTRLGHTSSRRLQDVFKMSSRHLKDVLPSQNVFKTSSRSTQDVLKTSSRRLQDVFKTSSRHLQDIFRTSSKRLQDILKTSSRRFQDVSSS